MINQYLKQHFIYCTLKQISQCRFYCIFFLYLISDDDHNSSICGKDHNANDACGDGGDDRGGNTGILYDDDNDVTSNTYSMDDASNGDNAYGVGDGRKGDGVYGNHDDGDNADNIQSI